MKQVPRHWPLPPCGAHGRRYWPMRLPPAISSIRRIRGSDRPVRVDDEGDTSRTSNTTPIDRALTQSQAPCGSARPAPMGGRRSISRGKNLQTETMATWPRMPRG